MLTDVLLHDRDTAQGECASRRAQKGKQRADSERESISSEDDKEYEDADAAFTRELRGASGRQEEPAAVSDEDAHAGPQDESED